MKVYIETYGCRMNICDSELLLSLVASCGYDYTTSIHDADLIVLNCCSVREIGHQKTYARLDDIRKVGLDAKRIVVCGCFATQVDERFFAQYPWVDLILGPDNYRQLPQLLQSEARHCIVNGYQPDELYDDILPLRLLEDRKSAAITVMKGCNQGCSFCIEPLTRGVEKSRAMASVLEECRRAVEQGYKEITFVGHIVDRYNGGLDKLLDRAATDFPETSFRFLSSHPLTFSDEIVSSIGRHSNIQRLVHLPVQSGSDKILKAMNRGYTRQQYVDRLRHIREALPDIKVVTDIMVGFCGETEEDFALTLDLVRELRFDDINLFMFSMRQHTPASRLLCDDVPEEVKRQRYSRVKELLR